MEKEGFIYIWKDKKHQRHYIGSHWGTKDDGYVCSSRWMRKAYRRRPHDFKRRIIQRGIPKNSLREIEYRWLSLICEDDLGKRYYNLTTHKMGTWPEEKARPEDTKKKISQSLKGNIPWNKGKTGIYSKETIEKIRLAN